MVKEVLEMFETAVDGQVLAVFHHAVQECKKRDISVSWMRHYCDSQTDDAELTCEGCIREKSRKSHSTCHSCKRFMDERTDWYEKKIILKEGDKSTALCPNCNWVVNTTLKYADFTVKDKPTVPHILQYFCDECGWAVSFPHQSSERIKTYWKKNET